MNVYQKEDVTLLINKNESPEVTTETEIVKDLTAPIAKGAKVGTVKYFINGEIQATADLVIHETINKAGIKDNLRLIIENWS